MRGPVTRHLTITRLRAAMAMASPLAQSNSLAF